MKKIFYLILFLSLYGCKTPAAAQTGTNQYNPRDTITYSLQALTNIWGLRYVPDSPYVQRTFRTLIQNPRPVRPNPVIDSAWILWGNTGLIDGVNNFLGTTDATAVNFMQQSVQSGRIDAFGNVALGRAAFQQVVAFPSASFNTCIGYQAEQNMNVATLNTAIGMRALQHNVTGMSNTGIGSRSLTSNTNNFNVGLGSESGLNETTGYNDIFVGYSSGLTNSTEFNNTIVGAFADLGGVSAVNNSIALGAYAIVKTSNTCQIGGILTPGSNDSTVTCVMMDSSVCINMGNSSVAGSVGGTCSFSEPFAGTSYKKIMCYADALNGTASYTFPTAFSFTPVAVFTAASITVSAISTSAVTISSSGAHTGFIIIEGY